LRPNEGVVLDTDWVGFHGTIRVCRHISGLCQQHAEPPPVCSLQLQ
jgi:hypothetical protein